MQIPHISDGLEVALASNFFSQISQTERSHLLCRAEYRLSNLINTESKQRMKDCLQILTAQVWLDSDSRQTIERLLEAKNANS